MHTNFLQNETNSTKSRCIKGKKDRFKDLLLKDDINEEDAVKFVHNHVEMQYQLIN
jgi:hypothetical protein